MDAILRNLLERRRAPCRTLVFRLDLLDQEVGNADLEIGVNRRTTSSRSDASIHLENLVEGQLGAFPNRRQGELERSRAAKRDRLARLLGPLLQRRDVDLAVRSEDDLVELESTILERLKVRNNPLHRRLSEYLVDGTADWTDERVGGKGGSELVGVGGELVQGGVDRLEGGGSLELGETGLEGTKALRGHKVGSETGLVGCGAMEGEGGESEVCAELAIEAGEDEIGADVGEEADLGLQEGEA